MILVATFIAATALAAAWKTSERTDPLSGDKVPSWALTSYWGYPYDSPSKYDLVFPPLTDEQNITFNEKNGYGAFNSDFEKVSKEEAKALSYWLPKNYDPSHKLISYEAKLAWLEAVYEQRKMNPDFWSKFYRLMAFVHRKDKEKSLKYCKKALPILEKLFQENPTGKERLEILFLLGEYNRRLGNLNTAQDYFNRVKVTTFVDQNGEEQVGDQYLNRLVEECQNPNKIPASTWGDLIQDIPVASEGTWDDYESSF